MGLRLRRSASFTPEHPALLELPGPAALRAEASVLVMGVDSVGKSALTVRFLTRRFIGEYGDMELCRALMFMCGQEPYCHRTGVQRAQLCLGRAQGQCCSQTHSAWLLCAPRPCPRTLKLLEEGGCEGTVCRNKQPRFHFLAEFIYSHTLTVDGREVLFHIWDVPNSQDQADDGSSEEKRIQWADSFVLVYSICDRASFNLLPLKVQFIRAAKEGQGPVPIVIVGNKRDLQHQRAVSSEEGRLSLDCGFYEVSAAEAYHGALMVFHGLAERIPDPRLTLRRGAGIRDIVKTVSAVFARRRTDSL
ncbi:ras-related and estrogen-regulated growth inhibitor-like protein [Numida meleagris]|uniref:ras-related and estrogen-regulated growth inhibitor-like protein n=1 Tax=Numida meleagris TaxID=8996 RepID=UPI000B3D8D8D|nr:ras-related and estrogen-regulated growth inhibitor-like protein [Numida meleagris]